jgi:hypothetical protein
MNCGSRPSPVATVVGHATAILAGERHLLELEFGECALSTGERRAIRGEPVQPDLMYRLEAAGCSPDTVRVLFTGH